jgi:hypothetical protein
MTGAIPVLAEATGQAADAAPWWFTGIVGLVGTIIGGVITYITTTRANKQEAEAERERQRKAEIREISIRFIRLVSRPEMQQAKIEEIAGKFRTTLEGVAQGRTVGQMVAEIEGPNPLLPNLGPIGDMAQALSGVFKEMQRMAPHISATQALVAEMKLILPNKIVQIAEIASNLAIMEQLKEQVNQFLPKESQVPGLALVDVLAVFTDAIRREMGVDPYASIDTSNPLEAQQFMENLAVDYS